MDEAGGGDVELRFSLPDPRNAPPALRRALVELAAAVEEEREGPEVEGFGQRPRVEIGSLAPTPGTKTFRPPTGDSWMVCIGNDGINCDLFYCSE